MPTNSETIGYVIDSADTLSRWLSYIDLRELTGNEKAKVRKFKSEADQILTGIHTIKQAYEKRESQTMGDAGDE